jgi:hypothetical protein
MDKIKNEDYISAVARFLLFGESDLTRGDSATRELQGSSYVRVGGIVVRVTVASRELD